MSDVVYRPGEWQVVVEESGIAALPADAGADKVVALSAMLNRRMPELTEAIDVLSGGAITGLGSFAVALIGPNGTRFAVRGAVTVTTGVDASFSGEDITTWSERFIAEPPRFEISFGESSEATEYPIRSGVVLASGIRVGEPFTAQDEDDAAALPAVADADGQSAEADAEPETDAQEPAGEEPAAEEHPAELSAQDAYGEVPTDTIVPEDLPSESAPSAEAAPAAESAASDEAPNETMAPDEIALARRDDNRRDDASAEPDLGATIAPPASAASDVPPPPAPEPVATAPLAPPAPDPWAVTAPPAPGVDIGDHDGATISLAEARRLRGSTSAPDAPTEVMPVQPGDPSSGTAVRVRLSTGQVVDLDRPVIIGRKPRATRASGTSMPHLIAVESPSSDISRNHLEVRPEGDSVVVIDLHTTNGSTLLRPNADPVRLHPGEQTLVLGGDVIDMGDGVTVTVEELG